ncbi:iron permease [Punctularia strigosozonata HHB-11173 SS5]|uniref:iron permease n=1 Tax=Punctularia strigosozonata (strain HHB-11173) TaxID=741275 RepID=UPI0004416D87|nr:iron permease [Punctularia strigosozonata HHB-11173 SS5]EIN09241.1 iron permease [Punctularia strigosozonata HHB-11173 SS5]
MSGNHRDPGNGSTRGLDFWLAFIACMVVDLLSALDLTAVSTTLPTIVSHLHGQDFIWVASAYTIASTAVLPLCGGVASIFGRKPALLCFVAFFSAGSAICGAAQNMPMLIAGRAIQGFGGGGCLATTEIIYADMIPLPERGKFQGIQACVWAFACAIAPPIGGVLASSGAWRFLFFLNLPLCGIATVLIILFLRVRAPKSAFMSKIGRLDWIGNAIIISSTTSLSIGLAWGGVQFSWSSWHVLLPICLGVIGIVAFFFVEALWVVEPTVPFEILHNRTTISGYLGTFFHGIVSMAVIFAVYLPVYFQASKGASAVHSGVLFFGSSFSIPLLAIGCGISVQIVNRYRPQNYVGWTLILIGLGLLSTLDASSTAAQYTVYQVIAGLGLGIVWISTQFPILAPLEFSNNAHALAFFTFVRCFAQSLGTVIGGAILQNRVRSILPSSLVESLPAHVEVSYALIPLIRKLPPPLKGKVQEAFARSIDLIWRVMIGISGAGLLSCLLMSEVEMRQELDDAWGLEERRLESSDSRKSSDPAVEAPAL